MKHGLQTKALSLVLALVMLLPLISIPTFAETDASTPVWTESFDGKTRAEALAEDALTPYTSKVTAAAKDADVHGDVLHMDAVPYADAEYYLYFADNNFVAIDEDYETRGSGDSMQLRGTAGDYDIPWAPINTQTISNTMANNKTVSVDGTTAAVVPGTVLDASRGFNGRANGNVMAPADMRNPAVSGDGKYLVISLDLYLSADLLISNGITGRVMVTKADGGEARIELFRLENGNAGYAKLVKHNDSNAVSNQGRQKVLKLGEWHTLTFIVDRTTARLTGIADGVYVFQSLSDKNNNGAGKLIGTESMPLSLKANTLQVEIGRGAKAANMAGYIQLDNAEISLGDSPEFSVLHDFDEFNILSNVATSYMTGASIVSATEAADERGNVLNLSMLPAPNTNTAKYPYWLIKDANNKWAITDATVNADGTISGTANGITITNAKLNTTNNTYAYTVGGVNYYVCTPEMVDAWCGAGNFSNPIKFRTPAMDFSGDFYTVSFDIYLSEDFETAGTTARFMVNDANKAEARVQLFQIYSDNNLKSIYIRQHGDGNIYGGHSHPLTRGEWNTLTFIVDRRTTRQYTFINGEFAFGALSNKSNQKPTYALVGTEAIPLSMWESTVQIENSRNTRPVKQSGYMQIDDLTVTVGDAPLDYNAISVDFDDIATGSSSHGLKKGVSNAVVNSKILNNYGSNAWNIPNDGNADYAQYLYTPEYSFDTEDTLVYEVDYFIEREAKGQIQQQIQAFSAVGNGGSRVSGNWLDLYQLNFTGDGEVTFKFENGGKVHEKLGQTAKLNVDRWNNIALVIDLSDGLYDVYINGTLTFDDVPLYRNINSVIYRLTDITISPDALTIGKTNRYQSAYAGNFQIDNIRIFTGDTPTAAAENPNATDFEEFKYVAGKNTGMAKLPSLATIETLTDGNTVFRVDMAPAGSADSYVLMQASGTNAAKATLSGTFEWNLADKTQGTLNGEAITLVQNGSYYEYTVNDVTYRAVSAAVAGASIGGVNVCVPSKRTHSSFSYATDKTIMLSADYFIEEGSTGIIESQFEKYYYGEEMKGSTYFDLYKIYMETGRVDNGLYLNIGEWNNIKVIFDLVAGEAMVYVNGVYSHTKTDKDGDVKVTNLTVGGTADYSWSMAKVFRQANMNAVPFVGGLLIDNVSIGNEIAAASESFGDKFLSDEAFLTFATDATMQIVNGASIRLKEADKTGLRFATLVNEDAIATQIASRLGEGATVEIGKRGTLIAPATYYEAAEEFTHAGLEALPVSTKYVDVAFGGLYFGGDAGVTLPEGNYMVGSIVKLKSYTREFAAAGYLELIVNGESYMLYTDVVIRSAAEVASAALTDPMQSWSDEHKEILENYAGIAQS